MHGYPGANDRRLLGHAAWRVELWPVLLLVQGRQLHGLDQVCVAVGLPVHHHLLTSDLSYLLETTILLWLTGRLERLQLPYKADFEEAGWYRLLNSRSSHYQGYSLLHKAPRRRCCLRWSENQINLAKLNKFVPVETRWSIRLVILDLPICQSVSGKALERLHEIYLASKDLPPV